VQNLHSPQRTCVAQMSSHRNGYPPETQLRTRKAAVDVFRVECAFSLHSARAWPCGESTERVTHRRNASVRHHAARRKSSNRPSSEAIPFLACLRAGTKHVQTAVNFLASSAHTPSTLGHKEAKNKYMHGCCNSQTQRARRGERLILLQTSCPSHYVRSARALRSRPLLKATLPPATERNHARKERP